mgnify:CR=1 FL=1
MTDGRGDGPTAQASVGPAISAPLARVRLVPDVALAVSAGVVVSIRLALAVDRQTRGARLPSGAPPAWLSRSGFRIPPDFLRRFHSWMSSKDGKVPNTMFSVVKSEVHVSHAYKIDAAIFIPAIKPSNCSPFKII